MSYVAIAALTVDQAFGGRVTAAATEQAETFTNDGRADIAAVAGDVLRGYGPVVNTFVRMGAAGPGMADAADPDDTGRVDQSLIGDADLLSLVQAQFPTVASLYYDPEGVPLNDYNP